MIGIYCTKSHEKITDDGMVETFTGHVIHTCGPGGIAVPVIQTFQQCTKEKVLEFAREVIFEPSWFDVRHDFDASKQQVKTQSNPIESTSNKYCRCNSISMLEFAQAPRLKKMFGDETEVWVRHEKCEDEYIPEGFEIYIPKYRIIVAATWTSGSYSQNKNIKHNQKRDHDSCDAEVWIAKVSENFQVSRMFKTSENEDFEGWDVDMSTVEGLRFAWNMNNYRGSDSYARWDVNLSGNEYESQRAYAKPDDIIADIERISKGHFLYHRDFKKFAEGEQ